MKNANAHYKQVKTWRRWRVQRSAGYKDNGRDVLDGWNRKRKSWNVQIPETEVLPIMNFDCQEAIASQQKQQDLEDFNELDFN